ncbi:MAG: C39 family peptidase [Pseudomonadota bacterium]
MASEPFDHLSEYQLTNGCGPTALATCLRVLGIEASAQQVARATGHPWRSDREFRGVDEHDLQRAARHYDVGSRELKQTRRSWGGRWAAELAEHLDKQLPALVLTRHFEHWIAVLAHRDDKFVIMDSLDRKRCFSEWTVQHLRRRCWNDPARSSHAVEGETELEPAQFFAILIGRNGRKPAWVLTPEYLQLSRDGGWQSARHDRDDLLIMVDRALRGRRATGPRCPLHEVLTELRDDVVDAVDLWSDPSQRRHATHALRGFYQELIAVAEAARLNCPLDIDRAALAAQLAALVSVLAWNRVLS